MRLVKRRGTVSRGLCFRCRHIAKYCVFLVSLWLCLWTNPLFDISMWSSDLELQRETGRHQHPPLHPPAATCRWSPGQQAENNSNEVSGWYPAMLVLLVSLCVYANESSVLSLLPCSQIPAFKCNPASEYSTVNAATLSFNTGVLELHT